MKKMIFAILAGCSLLAVQAGADALSTLQNINIKAQEIASYNNLRTLRQTVTDYWFKNQRYPTFAELNLPAKTLANPYRGLGAESRVPSRITPANSGYAYFGAALNGTGAAIAAPTTTPLAFEKPWIRKDGKLLVLFAGGKLKGYDGLKAGTCAEVIAALKKEVKNPDAIIWNRLADAAREIDKAR